MLKGICLKCGRKYYGWALASRQQRFCDHCGGKLHITRESSVRSHKFKVKSKN